MSMRRLWWLTVGLVLGVALTVARPGLAQSNSPLIEASRLSEVVIFPTRESFAEVVSLNESRLALEAAGVVLQWHADVGARVTAGQLLLELDERDARLALAQAQAARAAAQARLDLAQTHLKRAQDLSATGFTSQEALTLRQTEVALALAELASAQAHADLAARQVEKMQLSAPFDGVIVERHAQVGEKLPAGTVAFVLTDPDAIEVQSQLSSEQISSLQKATVIDAVMDETTYPLELLRVSPVAVLPSRTQTVRLGFKHAQRPVAGATGQLRWQVGEPLLQADLLVRRASELGIFVLEPQGSGWLARFVGIDHAQEGRRARAPALAQDTWVVTSGQQRLKDGQVLEQADVRLQNQ